MIIIRYISDIMNIHRPIFFITAGIICFFPFLLIHRLGNPKCVVSGISGYSDMFVIIRHFRVSVRRTGTFLVYIIREEAQSFATHDLRCRACLPHSELAVWWTSVSRWFLT